MHPKKIEKKALKLNGFNSFNQMQKKALKKDIYSKNLVLSAPTASGKTLISELSALNCIINKKKKVAYTCPLKAIASEHYSEFKKRYSKPFNVRTAISTGDLDSSSKYLSKYDLIFCTNEKIDSLIRHQAEWLKNIGLLIVDEVHELDSERGATLEMVIAKLRSVLPKLQILALSATIPNAGEIAEWLSAELVKSNYRPVELREGILFEKTIHFKEKELSLKTRKEQLKALVEDTLNKKKQALFFLNTRRNAEGFAKKTSNLVGKRLFPKERDYLQRAAARIENVLERPTEQCKTLASLVRKGVAFHHAGLLSKQRKLVEDSFKAGKLKVIGATPTLAMGVNLPSFRVVIPSLYRYTQYGMQRIPVREYKQMSGRCITGETIIFNKAGKPIKVSDIASKYFKKNEFGEKEIGENLWVLSFNLDSHKIEPAKVKKIWRRESNKIMHIKTKSGKRIEVTPEHPFLTFSKIACGKARIANKNDKVNDLYEKAMELRREKEWGPTKIARDLGAEEKERMIQHWFYDGSKPHARVFKWAKAKNLRNGKSYVETDYLSSAIDFHSDNNNLSPRKFLPLENLTKIDEFTFMTKQGHKKCAFPKKWSTSLVRFIAKIMADGNMYYSKEDNSYQIRYYSKDRKAIEKYVNACSFLFGKKPSFKWRRGTYQCTFKSFLVGQFLVNLGIPHGKKSFRLKLPKPIFLLPKKLIRAFIREYVFCDGWEEPDRYCMITSSKRLAFDLALLLSKIGYIGRVYKKKPNDFRENEIWEIRVSKNQFDNEKKLGRVGQVHPDLIREIKMIEKKEPVAVYDIGLEKNHNFIANGVIIHNSGRPGFDKRGESILVAKSEPELIELKESYVEGEIERIESDLALEPVLRMHLLALIASRFVFDFNSMKEFFKETFYSHQFQNTEAIMEKLNDLTTELEEFGFVKEKDGKIFATPLGKRVSDLYLDPLSANKLVSALKKKPRVFSYLYAFTNTSEFSPLVSVPKRIESERWQMLLSMENSLPVDVSTEQFFDDALLDKFNSALLLREWINEKSEQKLLDEFNTKPGTLFSKLQICDWLAYSAIELSKLLEKKENLPVLQETRKRLKYGVKKELLPLVELKNIGRVRSRRLHRAGLRSVKDLKKAPFTDLKQVLGEKTARSVKKQLGERVPEKKSKTKNSASNKTEQKTLSSFK